MTITTTSKLLASKALRRITAGVVLGLIASSSLSVLGKDGPTTTLPVNASTQNCTGTDCPAQLASVMDTVVVDAARDFSRMQRNSSGIDKPDDGAYFTSMDEGRKFDPCAYADGRRYSGKGTVLNPHARTTECLPGAIVEPTTLIATHSDLYIPGRMTASGGGSAAIATDSSGYLDAFSNDLRTFTGGGGFNTVRQIVTGKPPCDDKPMDLPTSDPVPLPAPALLFLTGLVGMWRARKTKRTA